MGAPTLLQVEGSTVLLWMNVADNCATAISNDYDPPSGEDLIIMRY